MTNRRDTDAEVGELLSDINTLRDLDAILDRLLLATRRMTSADAGSILLRQGDALELSYFQNDSLGDRTESRERYLLTGLKLPISKSSMAGYVAVTGQPLVVSDAYRIPESADYRFDSSVDKRWGYTTTSVLTLPIRAVGRPALGVLQLINAMDDEGSARPFTRSDESTARLFAGQAAMAIEHARMTRALTLRMIAMAAQRDPRETASHVNRVADSSVEIYRQWAEDHGEDKAASRRFADNLRIAAVLHDVGKVGIPDAILKKPGKLTDDEYAEMKQHTVLGARLFVDSITDVDAMASEIALNHHERWDGNGYPGHIADIHAPEITMGQGKAGGEIPLSARIVALADVYDALVSKRCYKDAWIEEDAIAAIRQGSGTQFDPSVVDAFMTRLDVIAAVRERHRG